MCSRCDDHDGQIHPTDEMLEEPPLPEVVIMPVHGVTEGSERSSRVEVATLVDAWLSVDEAADAQEFVERMYSAEDHALLLDYCHYTGCDQLSAEQYLSSGDLMRNAMAQIVNEKRAQLIANYMRLSGRAEGDAAQVGAWANDPREREAMERYIREHATREQDAPAPTPDPDEEIHECHNCGDEFERGDMQRVRRNLWCDACYNENFFNCESCGDETHREEMHGDGYCESCYEPDTSECPECGRDVENDDMRYDEERDEYLCPRCYDGGTRWRYPYGEDVLDRLSFQGTPKDGVFYGIELEVEAGSKVRELGPATAEWFDGWAIMKKDSSLENGGNSGFEIVTCPAPMEDHIAKFGAWIDEETPGKKGLRSYNTETCGLHVHITRKALSPLQLGKMVCFINNPLNRKFMVTIAQRDVDSRGIRTYAKFNGDKAHVVAGRIDDGERYNAVNLCNLHTVEIRIFKGTLNKRSLLKSLEFVHALVNYTRSGIVSIADSADYHAFIEWLGQPAQHAKYRNLISFLKDSGYPVKLRGKNAMSTSETVDGEFICA